MRLLALFFVYFLAVFYNRQVESPHGPDFRISCSKGTYIRAVARDMGQILGCGAHLTELVRTRIGQYHLRDAWNMEDIITKLFPENTQQKS